MHFAKRKPRRPPTVIIVSLIDVLLVVLIFLMVTTSFKNKSTPELKLALPSAKQPQAGAADAKPFVITVATNFPYFFIENKPVTLDRLQGALVEAARQNPHVKVAIRADRSAPFGEVIKVIDAAKIAQVGSISALTE